MNTENSIQKKKLYDYQLNDLYRIFDVFKTEKGNFNLLYQLPTGGGKTIIFSEIVKLQKKFQDQTTQIKVSNLTNPRQRFYDEKQKYIGHQVDRWSQIAPNQFFV